MRIGIFIPLQKSIAYLPTIGLLFCLLLPAGAAAKSSYDDNLLAGLSHSDIRSMGDEARQIYRAQRWQRMSKRSTLYRYRILRILRAHWAPKGLQMVPVVESGYNPYALSHAGAVGLWQIMPATARMWGAGSSNGRNGRRSVEISTDTAVRYLLTMFDRFGSWPLAIAGYNMGPYGLARHLRRHPWKPWQGINALPVPRETLDYVRRILGLVVLWQQGELAFAKPVVTTKVKLAPPVDVSEVARLGKMQRKWIYRLNPGLDFQQYYEDSVTLYLPLKLATRVVKQHARYQPKVLLVGMHAGDSLWRIAHRFGTTIAHIRQMNPALESSVLHVGQILLVPARGYLNAVARNNPLLSHGHRIHYKIRTGDSLWGLALRFGTTVKAIVRINELKQGKVLHPGKWIWIKAHHRVGRT
ncbi:MAG: LysM peptidoglycan-binding domain-containing protein [Mariprofundales bacterium]|nr:LysM peptidoglycan-binding domain-containing protein [Mariprofundales bacterium]